MNSFIVLFVASLATGTAFAASAVSPRYTITVAPGTGIVHVSAELDGVAASKLSLAFVDRAAPGLEGAFAAYRIAPRVRRRAAAQLLPATVKRVPSSNVLYVDVAAPRRLGDLVVEYDLDVKAALPSTDDADRFARAYQDRFVVGDTFATIRGDALFVPVGLTVERPRVRVVAPAGWKTVLNADRDGEWFVFPGRFRGSEALRTLGWFGLSGSSLTVEEREAGGLKWTLAIAPSAVSATTIAQTVWSRVQHYTATFGAEALGVLSLEPPDGIGLRSLSLFAVPFPQGKGCASGGRYFPGTAYFFFSPGCLDSFGHVVAHEYLHAYNCSALRHAGRSGADGDLWFREGYTEVQSILTSAGLTIVSARERARAIRTAIAESWAIAHDRSVESVLDELGLGSPPSRSEHRHVTVASTATRPSAPPPVLAQLVAAKLWQDGAAYDRVIEGRARLVTFGLALILERVRPGRRGFDRWLKSLLASHARTLPRSAPLESDSLHRACLEAAGGGSAELEDFYQRYVLGNAPISLEQVRAWISDDAINTICPRIAGRDGSSR